MNKNIIIPLVSVGVLLSFIVVILGTQNNRAMDQQAAGLRARNQATTRDQANTGSTRNLIPQQLACNVTVTSNPPSLPSLTIPNAPFTAGHVMGVFNVTSFGCNPGDAFFYKVKMLIIASNLGATRMDNFTITNLSTGATTPSIDGVYGPVTTISFKPGVDISTNGTTTFEVRADLNLNTPVLVSGVSNIITVMDNFEIFNSAWVPVIPSVGGLTSQQMTY